MAAAAVLDASALIALWKGEAGGETVLGIGDGTAISAVNWIEVLQVLTGYGLSVTERRDQLGVLGIGLLPLTPDQADTAAALHSPTRKAGLSLADRACLALALELGVPALTADRAWTEVDVGVEVRLIR